MRMADNRELRHGEKRMAWFTSEKGRDRANAQRAIEGLNQNDQILALLTDLVVETQANGRRLDRTNQLLEWLGTDVLGPRRDGDRQAPG